mmetsp:Transcript_16121/g.41790  ORF Transcript_16121/g.41790 Transcript_16121/m.41790 type:complete len:188 (+) Transcript_16121:57-620(+)
MLPALTSLLAVAVAALSERVSLADPKSMIIGPAVNFQLQWTIMGSSMDVCMSAPNMNNSAYLAIGFSGPKVPHQGMMNSDIVWGYPTADGKGALEVMYSNMSAGFPGATPTLTISKSSFSLVGGVMKACFTRDLSSGHNPIKNGNAVIWAIGPLANAKPTYHGADAPDPSGRTQEHRSDEVPAMQWM